MKRLLVAGAFALALLAVPSGGAPAAAPLLAPGDIETYAGGGSGGDGSLAADAHLDPIARIALDPAGNLYIAESDCDVRRIDRATTIVTTVATGICTAVLAVDATGAIYHTADPYGSGVCRLFRWSAGVDTHIAGTGFCIDSGDGGLGVDASIEFPADIAVNSAGDVFTVSHVLRRIDGTTGIIDSISVPGSFPFTELDEGPAGELFALRAYGSLYAVNPALGTSSLVAPGCCEYYDEWLPAAESPTPAPSGDSLAVDGHGNVYLFDVGTGIYIPYLPSFSCRLHIISAGVMRTYAGSSICAEVPDGTPIAAATFDGYGPIVATSDGDVYFPASNPDGSGRIRVIRFADADADGVPDAADNCPGDANPGQENADAFFIDLAPAYVLRDDTQPARDLVGDACDPDDDNDGLPDADEVALPSPACPSASAPTDPYDADTDGDLVVDGAECTLGSDPASALSMPPLPASPDADRDLLSDGVEALLGTDPADNDSDGDGVQDGVEFRGYGTDPLDTNTDGDLCGDGSEIASVNEGRSVDVLDLQKIAQAWAAPGSPAYHPHFDVNKDGAVNIIDLFMTARLLGPCIDVAVNGTSAGIYSPLTVDLGDVAVGTTAVAQLLVENRGTATLDVRVPAAVLPDLPLPADAAISPAACVIPPGGSCLFEVTIAPPAPGSLVALYFFGDPRYTPVAIVGVIANGVAP